MKILCIDKPQTGMSSRADLQQLFHQETATAWKHYSSDVLREMYFRSPPEQGAILVLECSNVAEAKQLLDQLPLTQAGVIEWDVIGLAPFALLSSLFDQSAIA